VRGGGSGRGSGLLPVRRSDRWAAAGSGGNGGGGHGVRRGQRHRGQRRCGEGCPWAVPAGVAGQAPTEPYVPGSGGRVPAEFRLVLVGYAGIACGLFVGALACAAAAPVFFISFVPELSVLAVGGCIWGLRRAFKALKARIRFSRLLRRPSDPRWDRMPDLSGATSCTGAIALGTSRPHSSRGGHRVNPSPYSVDGLLLMV
jgi:hypothetical protein